MNFCNRVNHVIKFFNRGFNAHVDGYIFQFVCVAFAGVDVVSPFLLNASLLLVLMTDYSD